MATGAAGVPQDTISQETAGLASSPQISVEMSDLHMQQEASGHGEMPPSAAAASTAAHAPEAPGMTIAALQEQNPPVQHLVSQETHSVDATASTTAAQSSALVASPDHDGSNPTEAIESAPADSSADLSSSRNSVVDIVLLPMNGNRYPCKISAKYLRNQKIEVEDMDPFNISVYILKELIWRDWKGDWETRPTNPGAIRLINMGRVLEDKQLLKDCRFSSNFPTVLHMSVKPQQDADDEDGKVGKAGSRADRDDSERTAGCRCVIL